MYKFEDLTQSMDITADLPVLEGCDDRGFAKFESPVKQMNDDPFLIGCYDNPFLMECYDDPFLMECYDDPFLMECDDDPGKE